MHCLQLVATLAAFLMIVTVFVQFQIKTTDMTLLFVVMLEIMLIWHHCWYMHIIDQLQEQDRMSTKSVSTQISTRVCSPRSTSSPIDERSNPDQQCQVTTIQMPEHIPIPSAPPAQPAYAYNYEQSLQLPRCDAPLKLSANSFVCYGNASIGNFYVMHNEHVANDESIDSV